MPKIDTATILAWCEGSAGLGSKLFDRAAQVSIGGLSRRPKEWLSGQPWAGKLHSIGLPGTIDVVGSEPDDSVGDKEFGVVAILRLLRGLDFEREST